jgi:hypothetical protein
VPVNPFPGRINNLQDSVCRKANNSLPGHEHDWSITQKVQDDNPETPNGVARETSRPFCFRRLLRWLTLLVHNQVAITSPFLSNTRGHHKCIYQPNGL